LQRLIEKQFWFKKQKQRFEKSGRFLDALLEKQLSGRKRDEKRLD
jgi:hypothetical protein